MEFMLLFIEGPGAAEGRPAGMAEMKKFSGELARQGKLRRGAPLTPENIAWARVRPGQVTVSDGPFAETKELIGGFCIVDVSSRAEAIDIASRCPHARHGTVEVHRMRKRDVVADPGKGTPYLFLFRLEPGSADPDGTKLDEMLRFGDGLKLHRQFIETAPLASDPPPARIEVRNGKVSITDGPFAETKEGVGGYSVVRLADRAEAIELAKRYPHAKWGPVEVREIMFFDRTD